MKRVQITRALNKPSIRFVPVFLLPFLSLSSKIKNLLFSSKENLLTFLHAESRRRNEKRETKEEEKERRLLSLLLSLSGWVRQ